MKTNKKSSFEIRIILITYCILSFISCASTYTENSKLLNYNLSSPDKSVVLPGSLHEVSGLTIIDSVTFACIQDENGIIYIYDDNENSLKKQYRFNINGDYEGITRVNNTIYVLRSDGTLFEIVDYQSKNFKLNSYETGIPANNNEGLCYNAENNSLLIACKGKIGKGAEFKDRRVIYSFDLTSKKLSREPVFDFDLQAIKQFSLENNLNVETRTKKKGQVVDPIIKFMTSAICIHPITKKLYLLSAADHMLFIFRMNGSLEHIEQLNPEMFNKSEGITFFENGDMLITNEGQDKHPTLLRFNYQKK